ncbi:hypothetical protein [Nitrosovibrio tenuis]|nr:hypothetical protein [Nitrosovibrio tenuis]
MALSGAFLRRPDPGFARLFEKELAGREAAPLSNDISDALIPALAPKASHFGNAALWSNAVIMALATCFAIPSCANRLTWGIFADSLYRVVGM